jgi:YcxB-like protein
MNAHLVFEGTIRPVDALRAWRFQKRGMFRLSRGLGLLGVGGTAVVSVLSGAFQPVLLPGVVFFLLPGLTTRSAKRTILKNARLFGHHVVTFSEEGVHASTDKGEQLLEWSRFRRFVETDEDFILGLPGSRIVALPKHLFGDRIGEARALMVAKIGQ